uniref:Arginine kinase n=1 Tax=Trichogramma kaykai TaxID=54128 RepID=A0ABD2X2S2_9HYME
MPQNVNKKRPPSFDRYVYWRKIIPRGSQMTASNLRHWLSRGELDKLENVVLEGRGTRLLGESSPDLRTRIFLKGLPSYLTKISQIHDAVVRGSLSEVQRLVDGEPKKKLVIAKDSAGTPLIHKAVYYDHQNVLEWIIDNYPATVEQRDREGRTALHYCAACRDSEVVWDLLVDAGCDSSICDRRNNPAAYYLQHGSEIELPDPERMPGKRLRFKDNSKWAGTLDIKPSNIRIWIHNRDIGKLQHVLWEGHGAKLRCETSNNVRVRRFLEAVPFIQGTIKDLHAAVIKNDIDGFRKKLDEPVSPIILCAKDTNGLNVLHKAAGLGYLELAKEILDRYPSIVNAQDVDGRTPLHYAAVCRDGGVMYDLLVEYGADENKIDNKHKTAGSYKNRPADLDMSNLVMVPEAPRSSGTGPKNFDWRLIEQTHIQLPSGRLRHSTSHNNNTEEDSAFGSAESAKITDEIITPEIETPDEDKENSNLEESEEGVKNEPNAEEEEEEKEEEEVADTEPASDNNNNETESNENNENAEAATDNLEEEKSPNENEFNEATEEGEEVAEAVGSEEVEDQDEELVIGEEEALAVEEEQTGDIKDKNIEDEGQTTENEAENNDEGSAKEEAAKEEAAEEGAGEEGAAEEGTAEEETTEKNEESNAEQSVNEGNEENEQVDIQVNKNNDEEEITHQNGEEEEINSQGEEQAIASQDEAVEINSESVSNEPVSVIGNDGEHSSPSDENVDQVENSDANAPEGDNQTAKADENPAENEEQKETEEEATDSGVANTPNNEDQSAVEEKQEEGDNQPEDAAGEETEELLENGTMEQLAAIVLTGEGHRLIGRQSSNPELQAFIDNVPAYMAKIAAVHKASREGNLKDLQISLDRRKFAIAKDPSSPHGATPLHVAVIFGHTPIVRYLAGRFPETAHALDLDGRTPLHYAATLADNGHYYNLLLHLGANPLVQDNFGQKADFYKENQDDLSHKQLLRDFGAKESLADEMLVDKVKGVNGQGDKSSARRDVSELETLVTLERCFRLLTSGGLGGGGGGQNSSAQRRSSVPTTPSGSGSTSGSISKAGTLLGRCLRRSVFEAIKHRVTCMDHNLFDVIWPALKKYSNAYASSSNSLEQTANSNVRERRMSATSYDEDFTGNVVAPDFESYVVFAELLDPLIRDLHCVTVTGELPNQPKSRFFQEDESAQQQLQQRSSFIQASRAGEKSLQDTIDYLEARDIDPSGKHVMAGVVECTRNLADHQLPLTMRIKELEDTERIVTGALMANELSNILAEGSSEDEAGTYYTLSELLDPYNEVRGRLAATGLLLPITETENSDERRLHGKHWPYGRGVYVTSACDLAVWINVQDHLRIISCSSESRPAHMGRAYVRLARVVCVLDRNFNFKQHRKLGFLTSRPCALGNTLRFDIIVKLPGLSKDPEELKQLCVVRGLRIHPTLRKDTVRLGNQQSLSVGELQTYQDFERAVINILMLEKELALNSSTSIATVIANLFKRRRASGTRSVRP